jgi:hypothetical protein
MVLPNPTPPFPADQRRRRLFVLAGGSVLAALTLGTLLAGMAIARLNALQGGSAGASPHQPASVSNAPGSLCP